MKNRNNLVKYRSYEGESIRVVCDFSDEHEDNNPTLRVFVQGQLKEKYSFDSYGVSVEGVDVIRSKLEELADGRATSEEVVSAIGTIMDGLYDDGQVGIDDEDRDINSLFGDLSCSLYELDRKNPYNK